MKIYACKNKDFIKAKVPYQITPHVYSNSTVGSKLSKHSYYFLFWSYMSQHMSVKQSRLLKFTRSVEIHPSSTLLFVLKREPFRK